MADMVDTAFRDVPHELIELAQAFAPVDGSHATAVPGLQVLRLSAPGAPLPAKYEPGLVLVLQGRKVAMMGTRRLVYDALNCLVVSVTMLPMAHVIEATPERPYLCLWLYADAHEIGSLVLDAPETTAVQVTRGADPSAVCGLALAPTTPELLDAALRLLRLLRTPCDIPVLAPLLRREIFYRVLTGTLGPQLRALAVADSHAQRIARAIDLLKRRFVEPLRMDEVARTVAMSPSSFHQRFKEITRLSPLQYQKQLRLQHARGLMLAQGLDAAAAGHRVGYESASQFSRDYRRLFGAPPRAEVRRVQDVVNSDA